MRGGGSGKRPGLKVKNVITSRVSWRGNIFGSIRVSVCVCVSVRWHAVHVQCPTVGALYAHCTPTALRAGYTVCKWLLIYNLTTHPTTHNAYSLALSEIHVPISTPCVKQTNLAFNRPMDWIVLSACLENFACLLVNFSFVSIFVYIHCGWILTSLGKCLYIT